MIVFYIEIECPVEWLMFEKVGDCIKDFHYLSKMIRLRDKIQNTLVIQKVNL